MNTSLPDCQDSQRVSEIGPDSIRSGAWRLDEDEIEASADQRWYEHPEQHIPDVAPILPLAINIATGDQGAQKDSASHSYPVPMNGQRANMHQDRIEWRI